jgi:hypothetical protein
MPWFGAHFEEDVINLGSIDQKSRVVRQKALNMLSPARAGKDSGRAKQAKREHALWKKPLFGVFSLKPTLFHLKS